MASPARHHRNHTGLYFRALFADWHARSGALSALPDAPVVPDAPSPLRRLAPTLLLRQVWARAAGRGAGRRTITDRRAPTCTATWTGC